MVSISPCALPMLAFLSACASDEHLTLTVRGEGFGAGDAHVAVTQSTVNEIVGCEDAHVDGGAFALDFGRILQPHVGYRVDAFVDLDGDQRCQFGVDAVMSLGLEPLSQGTNVMFPDGGTRVGDDPTGCASFGGVGFRVSLSGTSKSVVRYALVRLDPAGATPEKLITAGAVVVSNGMALIDLPGAGQPGRLYRIDFFEADATAESCTAATSVYRVSPGAAGTDAPFECGPPGDGIELQGDLASGNLAAGECASFSL